MHETIARGLEAARVRTLAPDRLRRAELTTQHSPLMSPLVWDLAHIGQQEDLWLLRGGDAGRAGPAARRRSSSSTTRSSTRGPSRPTLPLLPPAEARRFIAEVRGRVLDALERAAERRRCSPTSWSCSTSSSTSRRCWPPTSSARRRRCCGAGAAAARPAGRRRRGARARPARSSLGVDADREPWSLDNERPAHTVDLPAFRIGRVPVTQRRVAAVHRRRRLRRPAVVVAARLGAPASRRGWSGRCSGPPTAPGGGSASSEEIPPDEPVQHICYFEAEAYAAWAGARLPTEAGVGEGLRLGSATAASGGAGHGGRECDARRWPTSAATRCARRRSAPIPAGASAYGVEQMIGDVWEWTSSAFEPWPGFTPMLYADYSAPFFGGDYRVLRGGSWAVGGASIRPSFRNWDHPIRRQIFSGLRLAWDREMCRHLAWLGRPARWPRWCWSRAHGLLRQSYAPRRQSRG